MCVFDAHDKSKHYCNFNWDARPKHDDTSNTNTNTKLKKPLINDLSKLIIPPLHCKLGIFTQFVKTLEPLGWILNFLLE